MVRRQTLHRHVKGIERYEIGPKLVVDVDTVDFVTRDEDRREVLGRIESRLFGLFPESAPKKNP